MKAYRIALYLALLATLLATFWPTPDTDTLLDVVPAAQRSTGRSASPSSQTTKPAVEPERLSGQLIADLFPGQAEPEPAPVEADDAEPVEVEPSMPEVPYQFLGRWQEAGKESLFLSQNTRLIEARVGDVIDGVWQIRQSQPEGLTLVYLPLDQSTVLRIAP